MNETLLTIGSFAITGVLVSAIVQFTKDFMDKSGHKVLYTIGISILGGVILYFLNFVPANIIEIVIGVWASANTFYLAVIKMVN